MKSNLFRRQRYQASRLCLRTLFRQRVFAVKIDDCINPLGFAFGKNGWHVLVKYLEEVENTPSLNVYDSILFRYHQSYKPISMKEIVKCAGLHVDFDPGAITLPWGTYKKGFDHRKTRRNRALSRYSGPSSNELVLREAQNLIQLKQRFLTTGYDPWCFPNTFVSGAWLVRRNGERRFVVLQGNHRVAVMSFLGYESFETCWQPEHFREIHEEEVNRWYYVKLGMCSREDALQYFAAMFILNGQERVAMFV